MTATNGQKLDMVYTELRDFRKQNSLDHKQIYNRFEVISKEVTQNTEFRRNEIRNKSKFLVAVGILVSIVSFVVTSVLSFIHKV